MKNISDESPERVIRLQEMRTAMDHISRIAEKAKKGEANESELAELKAIDDKLNSVPRDEVRG